MRAADFIGRRAPFWPTNLFPTLPAPAIMFQAGRPAGWRTGGLASREGNQLVVLFAAGSVCLVRSTAALLSRSIDHFFPAQAGRGAKSQAPWSPVQLARGPAGSPCNEIDLSIRPGCIINQLSRAQAGWRIRCLRARLRPSEQKQCRSRAVRGAEPANQAPSLRPVGAGGQMSASNKSNQSTRRLIQIQSLFIDSAPASPSSTYSTALLSVGRGLILSNEKSIPGGPRSRPALLRDLRGRAPLNSFA